MDPGFVILRIMDGDMDGKVRRDDVKAWLKARDENGDGKVAASEFENERRGRFVVRMFDKDEDGAISASELEQAFAAADKDNDGLLQGRPGRGRGRGRGRERRRDEAPKVGQPAPDFELRDIDGKRKVRLSAFKGKQPVALIFGSYT